MPKSIKEALKHKGWSKVVKCEFDALQRNETWILVPPLINRKIIDNKWLFRVKELAYGSLGLKKS